MAKFLILFVLLPVVFSAPSEEKQGRSLSLNAPPVSTLVGTGALGANYGLQSTSSENHDKKNFGLDFSSDRGSSKQYSNTGLQAAATGALAQGQGYPAYQYQYPNYYPSAVYPPHYSYYPNYGVPNYGVGVPNYGVPSYGVGVPNYGVGVPNYGVGDPNYGVGVPNYGVGVPNVGIGNLNPEIRTPTLGVGSSVQLPNVSAGSVAGVGQRQQLPVRY